MSCSLEHGAVDSLRFDRPFSTGCTAAPARYLPFDRIGVRHSGIGTPARPLASSRLGTRFSSCRAINDSQFMPGICR